MIAELRCLEHFLPVRKELACPESGRVCDELGIGRESGIRRIKQGIGRIVVFVADRKNDRRADGEIFDAADRIRVPDFVLEGNRAVYHFSHGVEKHGFAVNGNGPLDFIQGRTVLHAWFRARRSRVGVGCLCDKACGESKAKKEQKTIFSWSFVLLAIETLGRKKGYAPCRGIASIKRFDEFVNLRLVRFIDEYLESGIALFLGELNCIFFSVNQ